MTRNTGPLHQQLVRSLAKDGRGFARLAVSNEITVGPLARPQPWSPTQGDAA